MAFIADLWVDLPVLDESEVGNVQLVLNLDSLFLDSLEKENTDLDLVSALRCRHKRDKSFVLSQLEARILLGILEGYVHHD